MAHLKKRMVLLVAVAAFCLSTPFAAKAQGNSTLVLWHADGKTTEVELYIQPRISFSEGKLVVSSSVVNLEYPAEDVLRFTFKGNTTTGMMLPAADADYAQKDDRLIFRNISEKDNVAVYNTNGILVPVHFSVSADGMELPLASIPAGVYILKVNDKTAKFSKK